MTDATSLKANSDTPDAERVLTTLPPREFAPPDLFQGEPTPSEVRSVTHGSGRSRSRSPKGAAKRSDEAASTSMATIAVGIGRLRLGVSLWVRRCGPQSRNTGQRS